MGVLSRREGSEADRSQRGPAVSTHFSGFNGASHHSTARMARDMSDLDILKMELEQLKKEVDTPRSAVGSSCQETIDFVEGLMADDPLIKGVPDDKNPYKGDKGGCNNITHIRRPQEEPAVGGCVCVFNSHSHPVES